MRGIGTASLVLSLLAGVPALADTTSDTSATAQAAPTASGDPERKICHTIAPPTGSHLGSQKVCATKAQWNSQFFNGAPAADGNGNVFIPNNATAGGMAQPSVTPHGGGHGL